MQDWGDYLRFFVALVVILDPFATLPIFLGLTQDQKAAERARTARIAATTVAIALLISAFLGEIILTLLGTSLPSFQVGGGIVLFLMALSMLAAKMTPLQHTKEERIEAESQATVGVVPIGLPLLAGPGAIGTVIIEGQRGAGLGHWLAIAGVIVIVSALAFAAFRLAVPIGHKLGTIGLNILTRIFGLLLTAIAVQMIATGLRALFPGWA